MVARLKQTYKELLEREAMLRRKVEEAEESADWNYATGRLEELQRVLRFVDWPVVASEC